MCGYTHSMKRYPYTCKICGVEVISKIKGRIYCSYKCAGVGRTVTFVGENHPRWKGGYSERICVICNKSFKKKGNSKTCSRDCYKIYRHNISKIFGEGNPNWKGGRYIDKHGYILVMNKEHPFANNMGYVREHRLVVEKAIGRFLTKGEVVHHINHVRNDNRLENLQLLSKVEHDSMHLKEIRLLRRYIKNKKYL
jgi:hypothetical protein